VDKYYKCPGHIAYNGKPCGLTNAPVLSATCLIEPEKRALTLLDSTVSDSPAFSHTIMSHNKDVVLKPLLKPGVVCIQMLDVDVPAILTEFLFVPLDDQITLAPIIL
jgi:hypothetical protein